jgi:hypothetical protein
MNKSSRVIRNRIRLHTKTARTRKSFGCAAALICNPGTRSLLDMFHRATAIFCMLPISSRLPRGIPLRVVLVFSFFQKPKGGGCDYGDPSQNDRNHHANDYLFNKRWFSFHFSGAAVVAASWR